MIVIHDKSKQASLKQLCTGELETIDTYNGVVQRSSSFYLWKEGYCP
jgi:hypothetical protein